MKRLKVILSLFWLGVLLFALSGRTVHVLFEHGHDHEFVCTEKSTHVHEKEHSCFICEFELQLSDGVTQHPTVIAVEHSEKHISFSVTGFVFPSIHFHFTSRGPPTA